jgi:hypothetical protein
MNTGEIIILCANIPVLVAVSIVAYRERVTRNSLEQVGQFVQIFSEATMDHIFELQEKVKKENNEFTNN